MNQKKQLETMNERNEGSKNFITRRNDCPLRALTSTTLFTSWKRKPNSNLKKYILRSCHTHLLRPMNGAKKIRIGYVLKSVDVRTLVSSRYSENSSHTQPCIPMHNAHPCVSACTWIHTIAHPCIPKHTHSHTPTHELIIHM